MSAPRPWPFPWLPSFPWPRSLIARILLVELATLGVAIVALPLLTVSVLQGEVARYQNEALQAQAQAVAAGLARTPGGGWRVALNTGLEPIFATGYDGRAYMVLDRGGRLVAKSLFGSPALAAAAPRRPATAPFRTRDLFGVSLPVAVAGAPLWVVVTQDQSRPGVIVDDVARAFVLRYLAVLVPLLLLLPLVNNLVVRRLVNLVQRVSRRAAEIDAHNLHVRLTETGLPAEIAPLVHATNGLVERLEQSFRHQKEFSANVAHELRTPLAALQLKLDAVEDRAVREQLIRQVDRFSHVLSQLRDLARLETLDESDMERLDLRALAERVVGDMAPSVLAHEHRIEVRGEEQVFVTGDATLIELALRNLIDNAVRHTRPGVNIEVVAGPDGSLAVLDDGPGIVAEDLDLLVRRFWRADHGRTDSAGIGLSIVQRIVDVHRGALEIASHAPRGAAFLMRLRLAA